MAKEGISQVEVWGTREFGGVNLGDKRRTQRLVRVAIGLAESPGRAISSSCGRSGAQAVSRLFEREEVDVNSVLSEHKIQTRNRCIGQRYILAVQDTTALDFTGHKAKKGIGPITTAKSTKGLLMHTTLILNEEKTPLGIAGLKLWARKEEERGAAIQRRQRTVDQKESRKWLDGLMDAESVVPEGQPLLVIGDRESDVFALLAAPRRPSTDILVRVAHNRALADDEEFSYLAEAIEAAPVCGGYLLEVPRQAGRPARSAKLEVRAASVVVKAPRHRTPDIPKAPVKVWVVRVRELDAPSAVEPLEWTLLTTMPVEDLESAIWILKAYACRWVIEEFHRTLKTGCEAEEMQFETVERLAPALAVNSVVAWRILYLSKLSREKPEMDAETVATKPEIEILGRWLVAKKEKLAEVRTVQDFVLSVAYLGGFMSRKAGANPGVQTLWEGLKRLEDLLIGYRLATGQEIR